MSQQAVGKLGLYFSLVKFSHSIFALPFALISLLFATEGQPDLPLLGFVVLAAVSARTAAMAFNRFADRTIDARNPRTQLREIPSGKLRASSALMLTILASLLFVAAAWALNPLCWKLSFPVLFVLLSYSYVKRFSWLCHFALGLALCLAPLGAWIAAKGSFEGIWGTPLLLAMAVLSWVAGFDIIYACQDRDFDKGLGLRSIPVRFGIAGALRISRALHVLTLLCLGATGLLADLGVYWWGGLTVCSALLVYEHRIVSPTDFSRVNAEFFTANGIFSVVLCVLAAMDYWL